MTRMGYVALIGAPNAGKSTILNRLTGTKLSIVTPKPQTTRFRISGIVSDDETQIVFTDTPGIFKPRRKLDRAMVAAAFSGVRDADIVALTVDVSKPDVRPDEAIQEKLKACRAPVWLLLNKTDKVAKEQLLPITAKFTEIFAFERVFMISALTGEGVQDFYQALREVMPEGPFLFPPDQISDISDRMLAAEAVREQVFFQLSQEVPYAINVETVLFKTQPDGSVRIEVMIYVSSSGQKAIVLGKGGSRIREIGTKARFELEKLLETSVHLFLTVKERKGWDEENTVLRALGLDEFGSS